MNNHFGRWGLPQSDREKNDAAGSPSMQTEAPGSRRERQDAKSSAAPPVILLPAREVRAPARAAHRELRETTTTGGTAEFEIYGVIGGDPYSDDDDAITAKKIKTYLDSAGPHSRIVLRINSPGGDAFEGTAIYNLLRAQGKPIECYVDGLAASAASLIAMCGDTITMGTGAMLMIHNAWGMCIGYAADMEKEADTLRRISKSMAGIYAAQTGKTLALIQAMMDGETWLNAQECLENKFCTALAARSAEQTAHALNAAARSFELSRHKNVPEKLRRAV